MKFLYVSFLFLLTFSITQAQWTNQNPIPEGNDLENVFFINDNVGWIVGSDGFIMKTTNTGVDWIRQNSGTTTRLREVKFLNEEIGLVVGDSGIIIKTTNGGLEWTSLSSSTTNNLWSLHFLDSNTVCVVGWEGTILKTTNGGTSWISQNVFTHYDLFSVCFVSDSTGWAVGVTNADLSRTLADSCLILKTTNKGESWFKQGEELYPSDTRFTAFLTVEFIDKNNGFVGGGTKPLDSWRVAKTTDGGETWSACSLGVIESEDFEKESEDLSLPWFWGGVQDIFFKDINNGFCVKGSLNCRGGNISMTTNGGQDWITKFSGGNDDTFNSVFLTDGGVGFVVEFGGRILMTEDNGTDWVQLLSGNFNEEIRDLYFANDSVGWAVGGRYHACHGSNQNVIYKTTNSGKIWKTKLLDNYPSVGFVTVFFIDELRGWASGDGGFYTTTDGGENWIEIGNRLFFNIFFISQDTGWAGTTGGIFKSTDGGITWVQKNYVNSSSIYFSDLNNGWSVGGGGILKSTDGGETWIVKSSLTASYVRFYNANIGMCVGSGGVLITTDGGENWIVKNGPNLQSINFTNSTTVWGYTSEGTLYKTTDAGDTWNPLNTGLGSAQNAFFTNENTGWVGGSNGTMFKYYKQPTVPLSPTNLSAVADTFSVNLEWTDNSPNEIGFIIERKDGDSLSVNPFIGIDTVMANITSIADTGLTPNTIYTYRVFAYNNIGNSSYSNLRQITTISLPLTFQLTVSLLDGWNMVSMPGLHPVDQSVTTWWSGKDPAAGVFKFNGGYESVSTVELRTGYWMKNLGDQTYSTGGEWPANGILVVSHEAINANAGWNLIGGYEYNASVSGITTTPPGLQNSAVYKYSGGYQMADYIIPGYGYWIKLSSNGLINLPGQTSENTLKMTDYIKDDWGKIILTDLTGISYTLYVVKGEVNLDQYELPPMPPLGMFDVRFGSGRLAEDLSSGNQSIDIQGIEYPIKVRVENMGIRLQDASGSGFNEKLKSGEEVTISKSAINKLIVSGEVIPDKYALEQNYPNPFNPSTKIEFSIPEDVNNVTLAIFNALGQRVAELVNSKMEAGKYSYVWNASDVATGPYIYELRTDKFMSVKKMLLLK